MAQVTTSHFNIFDYWKDKVITKQGRVCNDMSVAGKKVINYDDEVCCWGCGLPVVGDYEKHLQHGESIDYRKLWNDKYVRSKLNRCHIIPGALGGEDIPENLFLMCAACHEQSPDTSNVASFFRWVYRQREKMCMGELSPQYILDKVSEELNRRGLPSFVGICVELKKMGCDIDECPVIDYFEKHVGTHGVKLAESTKIFAVADWLQKSYLNACLK